MYTISLEDMIQTLQTFQQSGRLQTELIDVPGLKGRFLAELTVVTGKITACVITNSSGQPVLFNNEALLLLHSLGSMNWVLDLQAENAPITSSHKIQSPPKPRPLIPRRIMQPTAGQINAWPRRHRAVFALIDGQRNIEQIAAILSMPRSSIQSILNDLQSIRIIILE